MSTVAGVRIDSFGLSPVRLKSLCCVTTEAPGDAPDDCPLAGEEPEAVAPEPAEAPEAIPLAPADAPAPWPIVPDPPLGTPVEPAPEAAVLEPDAGVPVVAPAAAPVDAAEDDRPEGAPDPETPSEPLLVPC